MSIAVTPLHPTFFAEVGGVDLTRPLPDAQFREIEAAFHEHAVLLFREQPLTDSQQTTFSERFGPVFEVTKYKWRSDNREAGSKISDISNIDAEGRFLAPDNQRLLHLRANQLWHTDNSFKHVPARASILSARVIPAEGGDTEYADMSAAYDALPDARKRELEDLVAEHSIFRSRARMGFTDYSEEARDGLPPVEQVLIRRHPATGRKALYLASHIGRIVGWDDETARQLIDELTAFATQPRFVHRHRWRVGDVLLWDNRRTMHRATPFDEFGVKRVLHRTTVSDEMNTVERRAAESPRVAVA